MRKSASRVVVWVVVGVAVLAALATMYVIQATQQREYDRVRQPAGSIDIEGNVKIDAADRALARSAARPTTQPAATTSPTAP